MATELQICNLAIIRIGGRIMTSDEYSSGTTKEARQCVYIFGLIRDEVLRAHPWNFAQQRAELTFDKATITGATAASPVVVTAVAHGFEDGDHVEISDVVGMTELNDNEYIIANKADDTFELTDEDGDDIDGSGYTAYTSGGEARIVPKFTFLYQYDLPSDCLKAVKLANEDEEVDDKFTVEQSHLLANLEDAFLRYTKQITDPTLFDSQFVNTLAYRIAAELAIPIAGSSTKHKEMMELYHVALAEAETGDASEGDDTVDEYDDPWLEARK